MIRRAVPRWQAPRGPTALFFLSHEEEGSGSDDTRRVEFFFFFFFGWQDESFNVMEFVATDAALVRGNDEFKNEFLTNEALEKLFKLWV